MGIQFNFTNSAKFFSSLSSHLASALESPRCQTHKMSNPQPGWYSTSIASPLSLSIQLSRVEHCQPSQSKGRGCQPHPVPKHALPYGETLPVLKKNTLPPAQSLHLWVQPPLRPPGSSCDSGRENTMPVGGKDPRLGLGSRYRCCLAVRAMERGASTSPREEHSRTCDGR